MADTHLLSGSNRTSTRAPPISQEKDTGHRVTFSQTRKYGIRLANFLPALPLCDRWDMEAAICEETATGTRTFSLDHTAELSSHYTAQDEFDSDVEQTLAHKWARANTDWELLRLGRGILLWGKHRADALLSRAEPRHRHQRRPQRSTDRKPTDGLWYAWRNRSRDEDEDEDEDS